jgi:hypothetical protein
MPVQISVAITPTAAQFESGRIGQWHDYEVYRELVKISGLKEIEYSDWPGRLITVHACGDEKCRCIRHSTGESDCKNGKLTMFSGPANLV